MEKREASLQSLRDFFCLYIQNDGLSHLLSPISDLKAQGMLIDELLNKGDRYSHISNAWHSQPRRLGMGPSFFAIHKIPPDNSESTSPLTAYSLLNALMRLFGELNVVHRKTTHVNIDRLLALFVEGTKDLAHLKLAFSNSAESELFDWRVSLEHRLLRS